MSDVSVLQQNTEPAATAEMATESDSAPTVLTKTNGAKETTPKFKRIKPEELNLLKRFIDFLPDGNPNESIEFNALPRDLRLLLLPMSNARLIERGLIDLTYNDDNGAIESVSVNPLAYAGYKRITETEEAPIVAPGGIRSSRGKFSESKYKIHKATDTNPHRPETRRWYTWEMYDDGDSIDEVRVKSYDRNIKLYTGKWFNGPDSAVIELDIAQGYLWIYDSSVTPTVWVSKNKIAKDATQEVETLDDQELTDDSEGF